MKKQLVTIYLLSIFFMGCAPQMAPKSTNKFPSPFEFTLIDSVPGTQAQLYIKAYEWMAKTFVSAKDVIQMQDKEAGKLIGKGVVATPTRGSIGNIVGYDYVHYTFSITVKDGRYKCVMSDFTHEAGNYSGASSYGSLDNITPPKVMGFSMSSKWNEIKTTSMDKGKKLLKDLKQYMHSKGDDF